MADIGALPTKNSVQIHSTTGSFGTIPAATSAAAGVMTAEHVKMLEALWQMHLTKANGGAPLVIQSTPTLDTSQFTTRADLMQALSSLPKPQDLSHVVSALRAQVDDLRGKVSQAASPQQPQVVVHQEQSGELIDARARSILEGVISGMGSIDERVTDLERVVRSLQAYADSKAEVEAA